MGGFGNAPRFPLKKQRGWQLYTVETTSESQRWRASELPTSSGDVTDAHRSCPRLHSLVHHLTFRQSSWHSIRLERKKIDGRREPVVEFMTNRGRYETGVYSPRLFKMV